MFCSPFRRRRKAKTPETPEYSLSREEAWQLYLAKLDDEANYFTVGDNYEQDKEEICTCQTCIVSTPSSLVIRAVPESKTFLLQEQTN